MANVATGDISVWIGKSDPQDYQYGELAWRRIPMRSSSACGFHLILLREDYC